MEKFKLVALNVIISDHFLNIFVVVYVIHLKKNEF